MSDRPFRSLTFAELNHLLRLAVAAGEEIAAADPALVQELSQFAAELAFELWQRRCQRVDTDGYRFVSAPSSEPISGRPTH
jgi:hypothetical protein